MSPLRVCLNPITSGRGKECLSRRGLQHAQMTQGVSSPSWRPGLCFILFCGFNEFHDYSRIHIQEQTQGKLKEADPHVAGPDLLSLLHVSARLRHQAKSLPITRPHHCVRNRKRK
ncbi:hypothetical protein E2C01_070077 [Portunus trituberculatus]|uniref:Uncharacterized protein n=1 Tax=Portunus trituberculatus TaxID=210409 RepID=A0A5B7I4H1_PORTR|nr:hypothetical protein [Portunus trituberculatus]